MSALKAKIEFKPKSGFLAAVLNIILPGLGYIYCGRYILGIVVLPFVIYLFILNPLFAGSLLFILAIDGFLVAGKYNRDIPNKIMKAMSDCPQCAEKVMPNAKVCHQCGNTLTLNG